MVMSYVHFQWAIVTDELNRLIRQCNKNDS